MPAAEAPALPSKVWASLLNPVSVGHTGQRLHQRVMRTGASESRVSLMFLEPHSSRLHPQATTFAVAVIALIAISSSCGQADPPFVERDTKAVFAPRSSDFFAMPLPHDLRLGAGGSPGLSAWPGAMDNELVDMWLMTADERLSGWGLTSGVFVPVDGEVDPTSLPESPEASIEDDSSVFLLDIDPASPELGRRIPVEVSWLEDGDRWHPGRLIAAVPVFGFTRRPSTTYALVVTDAVRDKRGESLGRSLDFHRAFEDLEGGGARAAGLLSPIKEILSDLDVETSAVVALAPMTTFDPNEDLLALADWAEGLDEPALSSPWVPVESFESYEVLEGAFTVPTIQTGARPYSREGEGLIEWGGDGSPTVTGEQEVRLILTVPKGPQPSSGFPITIYAHGSGGNAWQAVERGARAEVPPDEQEPPEPGSGPAEWLAHRGIATVALDFNMHGTRHDPPDTTGLVFYNLFGNVSATIDNFNVASGVELPRLSRLLSSVTVDETLADSLDAGDADDGLIRFDEEAVFGMGQSMGSTLIIPWATVDPRVGALVFSGAGGMLIEVAVTATEPIELRSLLEPLIGLGPNEELHIAHPLLHGMQNLWDLVDPVAKARHVALEPHEGRAPKDFLMPAGYRDGYFHPRAQAAVATALGADLAGEAVEATMAHALSLAGRDPVPYPLSDNIDAGDAGAATGGVTHFAAPHSLGHYVTFNQDGAKHQYTCFLASGGASIQEPGASATAACD